MSVLDSKTNEPLSTYSMQNRSNRAQEEKVPVRWLTSCQVDLSELSLIANWALLSLRAVHSSSTDLTKATIKNINSTVAMLYPCLKTTLKLMDVSTLSRMILTMLSMYMCSIAEHSLGGASYFPSMEMSSSCFKVSEALTKSANDTHARRLWLCIRCRMTLIMNVPSCQPTPGVDINWHFTPCFMIILNSRTHMMLLYILFPMSIRVTPLLVRVYGVTFLGYRNEWAFIPFFEISLAMPELIVAYQEPGDICVIE